MFFFLNQDYITGSVAKRTSKPSFMMLAYQITGLICNLALWKADRLPWMVTTVWPSSTYSESNGNLSMVKNITANKKLP